MDADTTVEGRWISVTGLSLVLLLIFVAVVTLLTPGCTAVKSGTMDGDKALKDSLARSHGTPQTTSETVPICQGAYRPTGPRYFTRPTPDEEKDCVQGH